MSKPFLSLLATTAALLAPSLTSTAHAATPHPGPATAVEMGDSYMSGEGGRWFGNSANASGSRDGSDRACSPSAADCSSYDGTKVYIDNSYADGCHRADVAQIFTAHLPLTPVNIACSGAVSSDLYTSGGGGTKDHGETPQGDQLLKVARTHNIRLIAVLIGGNDLNFAPIVTACFTAYVSHGTPCNQTQASQVGPDKLHAAQLKVERAIDQIRAVMRRAHYGIGDYRMVLEDYPVVIPHARDARYAEADPQRTVNGCPFYDADMNWAQDVAGPRIDAMVAAAAAARGVPLLDMHAAFVGHEICAKTAASVTPTAPPSPITSEWGRAVSGSSIAEGQTQEVFHPDAYGHMAFGTCLGAYYRAPVATNVFCSGRGGIGPQDLTLTRGSALPPECSVTQTRILRARLRIGISCRQVAGIDVVVTRAGRRIAHVSRDLSAGRRAVVVRLPAGTHGRLVSVITLRGTGGDVRRTKIRIRAR